MTILQVTRTVIFPTVQTTNTSTGCFTNSWGRVWKVDVSGEEQSFLLFEPELQTVGVYSVR